MLLRVVEKLAASQQNMRPGRTANSELFTLYRQEAGHHLARWVARQFVEEVDVARDGVVGEFVAHPIADRVGGQCLALLVVAADHPDGDALEGFLVVDATGVHVRNAGHGFEGFGDGMGVSGLE